MASKAGRSDRNWARALLGQPASPVSVALVSAVVVIVGAVYCSGYEALSTGYDNWPGSLLWATYALLPWYLWFEWTRRLERRRGARLSAFTLAASLMAVAAGSLAAERIDYFLSDSISPPLLLSLLRRTPGIAVVLGLTAISRQFGAPPTHVQRVRDDDWSLDNPAGIQWIGAADNYLELHVGNRVKTVRMTLSEAERQLAPSGFVRIHRSVLVNRSFVASVERGERGPIARLADGTALQAGKAFAANLRSLG